MNRFFVLSFVTLSSASTVRIPFTIDSFENLWATAFVPNRESPMRALLKPRGMSGFFHARWLGGVSFQTSDPDSPFLVPEEVSTHDTEVTSSEFVYGTVNILKNSTNGGQVVLNADRDEFLDSCVPGSVLTVRFDRLARLPSYRFLTTKISIPHITADHIWESAVVTYLGPRTIFEAPEAVFDDIRNRLISNGCNPLDSNFATYRNCDATIWDILPPIHYAFDDHGHFVFTPQDYLAVLEDGRFILRISRAVELVSMELKFNPFALQYTNVRLGDDRMELCDSAL